MRISGPHHSAMRQTADKIETCLHIEPHCIQPLTRVQGQIFIVKKLITTTNANVKKFSLPHWKVDYAPMLGTTYTV